MVVASPLVERTYSQEQNTQPSESLISVQAFDFETEEQQYQSAMSKRKTEFKQVGQTTK